MSYCNWRCPLLLLPLCLGLAASSAGCLFVRFAERNFETLLRSPDPVPNKVSQPVRPEARLAALWVGHATVLIQIDDKIILTDPILTSAAGQISQRLVEPGLDTSAFPPLDLVLVSHMHFDHLSLGSLALLEPKVRQLVLPQDGLAYLTDFDFPAKELATWQSFETGGMRVTAVPVVHPGYRYALDREWMPRSATGYVIEYHGITVYFGGDTTVGDQFRQTKERFPSIDLALIPIAPLHPREFMKRYHLGPVEALDAFAQLGAKRMLAIHHSTFVNSTDLPGEPVAVLQNEAKRRGLTAEQVLVFAIGEQRVILSR